MVVPVVFLFSFLSLLYQSLSRSSLPLCSLSFLTSRPVRYPCTGGFYPGSLEDRHTASFARALDRLLAHDCSGFVALSFYLSVCLSVCLSFFLSIFLSFWLSLCLSWGASHQIAALGRPTRALLVSQRHGCSEGQPHRLPPDQNLCEDP